ncbi:hypothetical protein [Methylobacterium sp. R2-1]|uniref:hypothetical protein n=1 Tax=Methylobacterium sp. R2-1 TaxID=2587064 RepID=UPI0016112ECF|nr:hypothetical protein [Methylobacterium sp. R2-1]MBB2961902.1 hypothetical protein [Methylobacterium sp. R2-1]
MSEPNENDHFEPSINEFEALRRQVAQLERRITTWDGIARREIDFSVARAVQSIGVVVDYLAAKGLLDKDDLRTHVERHFALTDAVPAGEGWCAVIDLYGWLTWAEDTRRFRIPGA